MTMSPPDPDRRHAPGAHPGASRTVLIAILVLAGCVNFIDRSAVSIALPDIRSDLHLSAGASGVLLSAFAWSYAIAQLPAGSLVDRFGARAALSVGLAAWSCVQALTGLVGSLAQFVVARVALGLGESPMFVGGARVCAERFGPDERAIPLGLLNASASLGPAIAPFVITPLMLALGWRASFVALGALGLAVALIWASAYRQRPAAASPTRDDAPEAGEIAGPATWGTLLAQRSMWGLLIGFGGTVYVTWLYVTWLPDDLVVSWHLSNKAAALWSGLPQAFGFVGAILGGWISDALAARIGERRARLGPMVAGLLVAAAASVFSVLAGSVWMALAAVSAALFAANVATTSGWALGAGLAPTALVATVEAMANIGGSVGGSTAPLLTGYVVQATGSFTPALLIAGGISASAAIASWLLVSAPLQARTADGAPQP